MPQSGQGPGSSMGRPSRSWTRTTNTNTEGDTIPGERKGRGVCLVRMRAGMGVGVIIFRLAAMDWAKRELSAKPFLARRLMLEV